MQQEVVNDDDNDDDVDGDDDNDVVDDSSDDHQMSELMIETSPVWHFFDLEAVDGEERVRCSECSQVRISLPLKHSMIMLWVKFI